MGLFYKLCLSQCLAGWSDIMCGNNLNVGHVTQAFHPNIFSYFRMLVGTIDFYYFVPFSMTLALSGGHKVSTKQRISSIFSPTFELIKVELDAVLKLFKKNILILQNWMLSWSYSSRTSWYYFWVRFNEKRETAAVLLTASENWNVGIHSDIYELIWCRLGAIVDTIELYSLILLCMTLMFI